MRIALHWIAVSAATRGPLDHDVIGAQMKASDLAGQRGRFQFLAVAQHREAIRRTGKTAADAIGRNEVLVGEHRELRVFAQHPNFALQTEPAAAATGPA